VASSLRLCVAQFAPARLAEFDNGDKGHSSSSLLVAALTQAQKADSIEHDDKVHSVWR
jgi:hypothetical protein